MEINKKKIQNTGLNQFSQNKEAQVSLSLEYEEKDISNSPNPAEYLGRSQVVYRNNENAKDTPSTSDVSFTGSTGGETSTRIAETSLRTIFPHVVNYSSDTNKKLVDFYSNSPTEDFEFVVDSLLANNVDEKHVLDFLDSDEKNKENISNKFYKAAKNLYLNFFINQEINNNNENEAETILKTLVVMKQLNPKNFEELQRSKGMNKIRTGELNVLLLKDLKASDSISDNYFYELFEKLEKKRDAQIAAEPKLQAIDKKLLIDIIELDPSKQNDILDYISNAKDNELMKEILNTSIKSFVEKEKIEQKTNEKNKVFISPKKTSTNHSKIINLIKLTSKNPEIVSVVKDFSNSAINIETLTKTVKTSKLPKETLDKVLEVLHNANNAKTRDVLNSIKFIEKTNDTDLLEKIAMHKQNFKLDKILEFANENNHGLLSVLANSGGMPFTTEHLANLCITSRFKDSGSRKKLTEILSAANIVNKHITEDYEKNKATGSEGIDIDLEYLKEVKNRAPLVELLLYKPETYKKIEETGFLELVNTGKIDSKSLKHLNKHSDLSKNIYSDLEKIKDGKSIVSEFKEGTSIEGAFSKTSIGDVVEIGTKMYINDGKSLSEWKMTKEKYLELFPPVLRFVANQNKLGNCYFVSSLASIMDNPIARVKLYKSFEQQGNDIIVTIKQYKDYGGSKTFKDSKLNIDDAKLHLTGAKGIQMYEHAYAQTALRSPSLDPTPGYKENQPDTIFMNRIIGGHRQNVFSEILGIKNYGFKDKDIPIGSEGSLGIKEMDESKLKTLLDKYSNNDNIILGFGSGESVLDNEYNLVSSHGYAIKKYNPLTQMVTINNPHSCAVDTEVPLATLAKYLNHFDITILQT